MKPLLSATILTTILLTSFLFPNDVSAQSKRYRFDGTKWVEVVEVEMPVVAPAATPDTLPAPTPLLPDTTLVVDDIMLPTYTYLPTVFTAYDMNLKADSIGTYATGENPIENLLIQRERRNRFLQTHMLAYPQLVAYNIATLPEAPKRYRAVVDPDPSKFSIKVEEIKTTANDARDEVKAAAVDRRYWLHQFNGLVQFSQAYNSPNWYQGGNNNLNMIANAVWSVKLNPAFHSSILFENTIAYKLAMNSAPDDSLRNYSISEDLLQINTKFGVKARRNWYYSMTLQFKTQLLNNYKKNTYDLAAAFLSPGELNVGLGMTYSAVGKRYNFQASIAPFSYNMKSCVNHAVDPSKFGIEPGHRSISQIGSNVDCKLVWDITHNIKFTSRLTAFTNYSYLQGDWENTLAFSINRFLSTQIYAHIRYDSQGARKDDSRWRKWQVKEILSFGFSYAIGTV